MTRAYLARVLFVVIKILCGHSTVLIAYLPITLYIRGIELHLYFYVLRDGNEARSHFLTKHLTSFTLAVYVGIRAVSVIC